MRILNLMGQYLRRCAERGGFYWTHRKGITLGSPLSPVIGAFFLTELDEQLSATGLFWRRYMDDIVVLAPTRWKLRGVVKRVHQMLMTIGLQMHPDKTFIGRVDKGFDFLGYHIQPTGLSVAKQTLDKFRAHMLRLYEQERREDVASSPLVAYVQRWQRWVQAGIEAPVKHNGVKQLVAACDTELHFKSLNRPVCVAAAMRFHNTHS